MDRCIRTVGDTTFRVFPLSRQNVLSFFLLLGVFSWNFGGVLERWDCEMFTFGVLGLSCGH